MQFGMFIMHVHACCSAFAFLLSVRTNFLIGIAIMGLHSQCHAVYGNAAASKYPSDVVAAPECLPELTLSSAQLYMVSMSSKSKGDSQKL